MITLQQYFIGRPHTPEQSACAQDLLERVNALRFHYQQSTGKELPLNPVTHSGISGKTEGGFRLPDCIQGAQTSSHKEAKGIDNYDPLNELDNWITDEILSQHGLYREHPDSTPHWCHLTTRAPASGHRTFYP